MPTQLVSTVRRCLISQWAWYMSDGRPGKGTYCLQRLRMLWFSWGRRLAEKGDLLRATSWKMIICAGYETVLLDGATDGIALTIDVSSTVIRQAVAPYESIKVLFYLHSDTCSLFPSKRICIQEWGMYADQLPNAGVASCSLLIVPGSNGCYVQEPKRR